MYGNGQLMINAIFGPHVHQRNRRVDNLQLRFRKLSL